MDWRCSSTIFSCTSCLVGVFLIANCGHYFCAYFGHLIFYTIKKVMTGKLMQNYSYDSSSSRTSSKHSKRKMKMSMISFYLVILLMHGTKPLFRWMQDTSIIYVENQLLVTQINAHILPLSLSIIWEISGSFLWFKGKKGYAVCTQFELWKPKKVSCLMVGQVWKQTVVGNNINFKQSAAKKLGDEINYLPLAEEESSIARHWTSTQISTGP